MTSTRQGNEPILLAFSGGLDTSFCVPWLKDTYQRPVITVTVDTGGIDSAAAQSLAERSVKLGATLHHLIDARAAYFEQVLKYLLMGNVRRGGLYPLCVGAERVLQAQTIAHMALALKTKMVAHGCTAAGNDQVRFEVALRTLAPELEIIAPVRDRAFKRPEQLKYLEDHRLPIPPFGGSYSVNRGLWGVTIGGRETLTSQDTIPDDAWVLSKDAFSKPRAAERHTIGFEQGVPASLDGVPMSPVAIIETLEALARAMTLSAASSGATTTKPMPMLNTRKRSSSPRPPSRASHEKMRGACQDCRSSSTSQRPCRIRGTLPVSPPPVICAMPCTGNSCASASAVGE
jgi:argininosuccinate synthase